MVNFSKFLKRLGLIKESTRGALEATPTEWVAILPESDMNFVLELLQDESTRGVMSKFPAAPGMKVGEGEIKFPLRAQNVGEFFHMLIGDPVSVEQSEFVVTSSSNDAIDFKEDAGSELNATLAAGSFPMGADSSVSGSLCAEIKTKLEAAGVGTYTITYSFSTKKLTVAVAGGASAVQLLWATGTNTATAADSLMGFTTVDTSSSASVQSDSTTSQFAFKHTFTPANTLLPQSYSLHMDRSISVKGYNRCNASQITLERSIDDFIMFTASMMFQGEASGSIATPVYTESEELTFQHDTFKIAGAATTQVKNWTVNLTNGLFPKRTTSQSQEIDDLVAIENGATGSFTVYFENETERNKFIAGTEVSIQMTIAGDTIQVVKYTVDLTFDGVQYTAFPFGEEDGLFAAQVEFTANYNNTNSRVYKVDLTNARASY